MARMLLGAILLLASVAHAAPPIDLRTRPNVFGGTTATTRGGRPIWTSRKNVFGGQTYRLRDGRTITCRRNVAGGQDCR